ncbi:molybdopterin-binding domain of aldehyde dehydrogenase domain-containing protein [Phthorimaea operculella]|nr:molybdopterin-binding domain of aldehyde dehydrogenase domain-containing protein [Phthorimaea operculella]
MDKVTFKINGEVHSVGSEISSHVTLLDYIREYAELRGTKYNCREGGCGACIVSAIKSTGALPTAVNSCLVSVTSCQDWEITTIEKVGNKLDGYDPLQTTLAEHHGTQCGYCTPGFIMAMYSLKNSKKPLTKLDIEKSFGSNICRCTGYRPILEAFKTFATDTGVADLPDIEDLNICNKDGKCKKQKCEEQDWCFISENDVGQSIIQINLKDGRKWFKVSYITEIFSTLQAEGDDSYMLVAGNTAKGPFPILEYPRILIDISTVAELKGSVVDQNLVVGAGNTLTEFLDICQSMSTQQYFEYLQKFWEHINLVAHIPVRNLGTIGGNLMVKHQHNEFPSDIFLLLETVGAQLTIVSANGAKEIVTMQQFLQTVMRSKIILNVLLPPLSSEYKIVTFKIMHRAQNSHAIVNCGLCFKLSNEVVLSARIVFGNLSPTFNRPSSTESLLVGKNLFTNETLQAAINNLKIELIAEENPPEPPADFRKQLAINLFYKGLLTLCPTVKVNPRYRSGVNRIKESRPESSAQQTYDTNALLWPLTQPVEKLEAKHQCAGEAPYSEDKPSLPREVFAAFVLSEGIGTIASINADKALAYPGVLKLYLAKDIPGVNSFTPAATLLYPFFEELLAESVVKYYHQPVGIIVAETRAIAEIASKLVEVTCTPNLIPPVVYIKDAQKVPTRNLPIFASPAHGTGLDIVKIFKGLQTIGPQCHMPMETLVCVSNPTEEGVEAYASTQWMDVVQQITALALNIEENKVDVHVRRIGGGFGMKLSRATQVAIASSMVAKKMNRPCRVIQSLTTNMKAVGKRLPCISEYEVAVNRQGVIQFCNWNIYEDNGYMINEPLALFGVDAYYNCYKNTYWNYKCFNTLTDTAKNTWCRSPGSLESIAMAEILMDRISYEMSLDPIQVRLNNLDEKFSDLKSMIETIKTDAKYDERRAAVDKFNAENRWIKRGLRLCPAKWTPIGTEYSVIIVSVCHGDGTVTITHGSIEMGQGINTKAAQLVAYLLKIPIEKIQIKSNNTINSPNSFLSGGSLNSQTVLVGLERACAQLLERLDLVRSALPTLPPPTWEILVRKAFEMDVDLHAKGFVNNTSPQTYNVYGVVLCEVEVDILTGQFEVRRTDILQDVGRSVNPKVDVGQVEGAFIIGLGYWTSEHLEYDKKTGKLLTDRIWHYYLPQARDIPCDFRITLKKGSYSSDMFFGAKGVGEPPTCLAVVIILAIREAIAKARYDSNHPLSEWFDIDAPYTTGRICMSCATKTEDLKFS